MLQFKIFNFHIMTFGFLRCLGLQPLALKTCLLRLKFFLLPKLVHNVLLFDHIYFLYFRFINNFNTNGIDPRKETYSITFTEFSF